MALNRSVKAAAALGIFFGSGFLCGFFSGYAHALRGKSSVMESTAVILPAADPAALPSVSTEDEVISDDAFQMNASEDIGLTVDEHWIDSDDNGLFIAGAVKNSGAGAFDAVRVAFDLLDSGGEAYSAITARNGDGV